jgi:hypothetical protein
VNLIGKQVLFRLSLQGREELKGLVSESGSFPALVMDQDELGFWVLLPEEGPRAAWPVPVMLLKWHHFSTATLDYEPESRSRPGFLAAESGNEC